MCDVPPADTFGALDACAVLGALLDAVVADFDARDPESVIDSVQSLDRLANMVEARRARLLTDISTSGAHLHDGHANAKVAVRHMGRLSTATAMARQRNARMTNALPLVAAAWAEGTLGTDHVATLGRVWANPRVRDHMDAAQDWFLAQAADCATHRDFDQVIGEWARLVDDDGPRPNERNHDGRRFKLTQRADDLGWDIDGGCGALQGATLHEIFGYYLDAETRADWDAARAQYGDAACESDLPRTVQQRSADALSRLFEDAAANGSAVPADFVHNIVWDADTFNEMAARFDGDPPQPLDPDTTVCRTLDGTPLEPTEAFANSLRYAIARVLIDQASVTIDQGRARCFTGAARHAVKLTSTCCVWPGCAAPVTACEIDHMLEYDAGGRTCPGNGAPLCGRHNRWKQKGYTLRRDAHGTIHVHRPDGTEIPR